jgi:hypothetical protein
MAAKINKTVKISLQNGSNEKNQMSTDNPWHGGASAKGMGEIDGVKRRGGNSPATGKGYGTAKGIGGGTKTTDGKSVGQDSDDSY